MASYLPYKPPQPYAPFTGTAPPVPTTAAFAAPNPTALSPYGQFRFSQGTKAIERGAAARGTLLTGGLQTRLAEFGQGLASEEAGNDYQRALSTYEANRGTDQMNYGREQDGFRNALDLYGTNRDTQAQNFGQERMSLAAAPAAPTSSVDPQADYNAMLQRRQIESQHAQMADERRRRATLTDENAALSDRQRTGNAAMFADEARKREASQQPAPAATGYQDMLAQYAEYQRQVEEDYRRQLAGNERQNAIANEPYELAKADARRRMLQAEEDARLGRATGVGRGRSARAM